MKNFANFFSGNERWRNIVLVGGAILLLIAIVLGFFSPALFFRAYLVAFVFWLGLGLGCLAILMLYHLANGAWGASMLRILEAGARTMPWLTLIGLPLYLSIPFLFVWAGPQAQADPALQSKLVYLNIPFFVARTIFYFVVWNALVFMMDRWGRQWDGTHDPRVADRLRRWGALGLAIFGVTVSFAAIDWVMSIEPDWFSTIFPALVAVGGVLAGFAFAVLVTALLARRPPLSTIASPQLLNDLGNLLLTFVMMWAYLALSQYLLIWMGNLSDEIIWYVHRLNGGWQVIAVLIGIFYFVLPFALLIIREIKRHVWLLIPICVVLLFIRWLEVFWLIVPTFEPTFTLNAFDVMITIGMGALWVALFVRELGKRPVVAFNEPSLKEAKEWAGGEQPVTHGE